MPEDIPELPEVMESLIDFCLESPDKEGLEDDTRAGRRYERE